MLVSLCAKTMQLLSMTNRDFSARKVSWKNLSRSLLVMFLDKFNFLYKPAKKSRQACIGCDSLSDVVNKGVNVDNNLVFCRDSEILSGFGTTWVSARCDCNTTTKKCSYKDSHGQDIDSKLKAAQCQSVNKIDQPPKTGPRMPAGLTCGRADPSRIVGGQFAEPNTWPWMVQLQYFGEFTCGGVIVGENLILTGNFWLFIVDNNDVN